MKIALDDVKRILTHHRKETENPVERRADPPKFLYRNPKLDSCMSGTFPPYMPHPTYATPHICHTPYMPNPVCATPYR